jgi:DNA-directed RNA polymerase subunit F
LDQLLADLDGQGFARRQKAAEELEKLGPAAEAALRKALVDNPSLEVQKRLEQLLAKATTLTPDRLRELRVIGAMERMATLEAKELLQKLAKEPGYPQSARNEALTSLERLARTHSFSPKE